MGMQRAAGPAALAMAAAVLCADTGCVSRSPNPQFPEPASEAASRLAAYGEHPRLSARPLLILGGYMDPGFAAGSLTRALQRACGAGTDVVTVSFGDCTSMAQCRERVLAATRPLRAANPDIAFDVVANSMGGLVARYCAISHESIAACGLPSKQEQDAITIHHLYTICTPHLGARMAEGPLGSPLTRDMRAGSAFLTCLDGAFANAGYTITCFAREGDSIVGAERSAPAGVQPIVFDTPPFEFAHVDAHRDPRILLVIVRSLRGDDSLTLGE